MREQTGSGAVAPAGKGTHMKGEEWIRRYDILCDCYNDGDPVDNTGVGRYYRTRSVRSGDMLEIMAYPMLTPSAAYKAKRITPTPEQIARYRQTQSERRLIRLTETNFGDGDFKVDLTIEGASLPKLDEVQKMMEAYIRRINYRLKRKALPNARYIYVIEGYEEGSRQKRLHAHLIIDGGLSAEELRAVWGRGRVRVDPLDVDGYGGLKRLASYLAKDPRGRKRWKASKNLKKPIQTVADRKISQKKADAIAEDAAGRSAALEKLYPGYEVEETEVRTNPFISGCYIYATLRRKRTVAEKKKARKEREQVYSERSSGHRSRKAGDGKRSRKGELPSGGQAPVQEPTDGQE